MITRPTQFTKKDVLTHALTLSESLGYNKITRDALAKVVTCSPSLISRMFGTIPNLHRAIISAAIDRGNLIVLGQGIAFHHAKAMAAPADIKRAAIEMMI